MRKAIVSLAQTLAPKAAALWRARHLISHPDSYLNRTGYLRSLQCNLPVDEYGLPLAFFNYPTLAFLSRRIKSNFRVLEFGSGYSTAYFAARVREVVAVEHEEAWLAKVRSLTSQFSNIHLMHAHLGPDYVHAADRAGGTFHVILVDGRQRNECALNSLPFLSADGVMLWDDSSRERYQEGISAIEARGFRVLRLEGIKPAGLGVDETAIIYRDGNCLGI